MELQQRRDKRIGQGIAVAVPLGVLALLCAVQLARILALNDGLFVYTLDDAYIHLALAENLAQGHYGVNPGEFAAVASSMLWPFLLAPLMYLPGAVYAPLVLNMLLAAALLAFSVRFFWTLLHGVPASRRAFFSALTGIFLIPAFNLIGLIFMGMEHVAQMALAVLVVGGLVATRRQKAVPVWFVAALVLGPLVRYENLALVLPTLAFLVARRHLRPAALASVLLVAALGGFSAFLLAQSGAALPNSVLAKSSLAAEGGTALAGSLYRNLTTWPGAMLALGALALFAVAWRRSGSTRALALWGVAALLLHLVAGQIGWYHRYELYLWAAVLLLGLYLARHRLARLVRGRHAYALAGLYVAFLVGPAHPYLAPLFDTPHASQNIYQQQYQMARFARDFLREPVAVNDLGWVAYTSDQYVLDLFGLASAEALEARTTRLDYQWIDDLATRHGVRVAMVYEPWFPHLAMRWYPVADLHLGGPKITPAEATVTFFGRDAAAADALRRRLEAFAPTLPAGVRLAFRPLTPDS